MWSLLLGVILISSFIYFVEKEFADNSGITNIPEAIWWAIITITTVGYGDYVPQSFPGKIIGALSLVFGVLVIDFMIYLENSYFPYQSLSSEISFKKSTYQIKRRRLKQQEKKRE